MKGIAALNAPPVRFSPNAILRARYGLTPMIGSTCSVRIFSGVASATYSISMPPASEAMIITRLVCRSRSMLR